ncbi:hypothetical protein CJU89_6044 [Yarrowia sp. B02]|nr:hypothetical protein CJU89_6044 [Yarrowia sp. B02]
MNFAKLLLYVSTVSAVVVTATVTASKSSAALSKTTATSSKSSRAQILATGTPPMFASAKYAIISNVLSISIPTASGYLAKDVEPTKSVETSSSSSVTTTPAPAQANSVSRAELSVLVLGLSLMASLL